MTEFKRRNREIGLEIVQGTIVPERYDMDMDYDQAVLGLGQLE